MAVLPDGQPWVKRRREPALLCDESERRVNLVYVGTRLYGVHQIPNVTYVLPDKRTPFLNIFQQTFVFLQKSAGKRP